MYRRRAGESRALHEKIADSRIAFADNRGPTGLEDSGLLAGDLLERRSQVLCVIEADRCYPGDDRIEHVGGIESTAKSGLDDRDIRAGTREVFERHCRRCLEERCAD